ncbi:MAG: peptidoglycan DD-metalloendopeptidase family protein [Sedimenticola sp.]
MKKGDTLYSISWRFDLAPQTLARMNGIRSPYTIYPGQSLGLSPLKSGLTQRLPAKPMSKSRSPIQSKANTVRKREKADPPSKREEKPVKAVKKQVVEKKYQQLLKLSWGWPTRGTLVQRFVKGDPLRKGVKLRGSVGQPVKAAEAGKVVYAGSGLVGYGRLIIIKHSKSYLSAYGLNRRILVKEGDQVSKGMAIAEMGEGGKGIAQLHFEIRHNGAPVNPLVLLPRRH